LNNKYQKCVNHLRQIIIQLVVLIVKKRGLYFG